jgi:hypothetical protein
MRNVNAKRLQHAAMETLFPLAAGLVVAQAVATVFVYGSNLRLFGHLEAITAAGYLPVPNQVIAATLKDLGPAAWGGLFYTLSIGTGLTLAAWAIALTWDRLLHRRKTVTLAVIAGWIGIVALVNWNGPTLYPSLFCILVPLATGLTTLRLSAAGERHGLGQGWIPIAALALLTALWATQLDKQLFASIRDHVLLSNPVGRSVNDFYYRYTLYAAEAFKSFDQKTLRTARIRGTANPEVRKRVEGRLAQFDVIAVGSDRAPDIELDLSNESLRLERGGKTVVETILDPFLRNPAASLSRYAKATDRSGHFRKLTLIGLLGGFPILLYIVVYAALKAPLALAVGRQKAVVGASALCLVVGVLLFLPMLKARPEALSNEGLAQALSDTRWPRRVAALRYIHAHDIDVARYPQYSALLDSPLVVERYWLTRALATSRSSATYHQLISLTRDPHPNVVCQAYYALGRRGDRRAVKPILEQMAQSDHWYAQWYGYRALRRLQWHQNRLQ